MKDLYRKFLAFSAGAIQGIVFSERPPTEDQEAYADSLTSSALGYASVDCPDLFAPTQPISEPLWRAKTHE